MGAWYSKVDVCEKPTEHDIATPPQTGRYRTLSDKADPRSPTEGVPRTPIDVVATPGGTPILSNKGDTPTGKKAAEDKSLHKRIMKRHPDAPIANTDTYREPRHLIDDSQSSSDEEAVDSDAGDALKEERFTEGADRRFVEHNVDDESGDFGKENMDKNVADKQDSGKEEGGMEDIDNVEGIQKGHNGREELDKEAKENVEEKIVVDVTQHMLANVNINH